MVLFWDAPCTMLKRWLQATAGVSSEAQVAWLHQQVVCVAFVRDPVLQVVCCDPDRLRGVLLNLYTNAGEPCTMLAPAAGWPAVW